MVSEAPSRERLAKEGVERVGLGSGAATTGAGGPMLVSYVSRRVIAP